MYFLHVFCVAFLPMAALIAVGGRTAHPSAWAPFVVVGEGGVGKMIATSTAACCRLRPAALSGSAGPEQQTVSLQRRRCLPCANSFRPATRCHPGPVAGKRTCTGDRCMVRENPLA
jgi:hypothetical protein